MDKISKESFAVKSTHRKIKECVNPTGVYFIFYPPFAIKFQDPEQVIIQK